MILCIFSLLFFHVDNVIWLKLYSLHKSETLMPFFKCLEDISPFCEGHWHPKARVDLSFAFFVTCMQWIPQIHLWCDTCWPLGSQHGSLAFLTHVLANISPRIGRACTHDPSISTLPRICDQWNVVAFPRFKSVVENWEELDKNTLMMALHSCLICVSKISYTMECIYLIS